MYVGFDLLDRQIVDRDGIPVGKVDEVELAVDDRGGPYLTTLLAGPQVLGPRIGGWLGRVITRVAWRLSIHRTGPLRIPYQLVGGVDCVVQLTVCRDLLPEPELESWLREHLIARIPGSGRAD
jgi:sporulation protein YlmC with PRC-barrel domain